MYKLSEISARQGISPDNRTPLTSFHEASSFGSKSSLEKQIKSSSDEGESFSLNSSNIHSKINSPSIRHGASIIKELSRLDLMKQGLGTFRNPMSESNSINNTPAVKNSPGRNRTGD